MSRKTILLASVAGALLASAPARAEGLYLSAFGGANFVKSQDGSFRSGFNTVVEHFDPDTGFLLGAALGVGLDHWLHGLKVEIEPSYRRNDVGGHWQVNSEVLLNALALPNGDISGNMSTFALMANAWYEFDIGSRFKPYVGGGAGWARSQIDGVLDRPLLRGAAIAALSANPFNGFSVENSGFAYQLGFGITSQIMPGVSLGLGYRFFDGPNTELFFGGKLLVSNQPIKFQDQNQSVALSLNIDIN